MKGTTIFYVDDDQDDLDYFSEVVNKIDNKLELVTHSRGEHLLHALDNPPPVPQVLFLDLNMPGLNGFEVLRELRSKERLQNLPVIIFSTSTDAETIEKTRSMGASYYLPKSGNYSTLKKSIEHILNMDWENFTSTKENFLYRNN
jgi:CheY-like chemotaxis protein